MQPPRRNTPETVETLRADAFQTHVEPELPVLFRVALTLTGSPADAEDLVQETLIRPPGRWTGSTAGIRARGCSRSCGTRT